VQLSPALFDAIFYQFPLGNDYYDKQQGKSQEKALDYFTGSWHTALKGINKSDLCGHNINVCRNSTAFLE
jgi:hypothetical protein